MRCRSCTFALFQDWVFLQNADLLVVLLGAGMQVEGAGNSTLGAQEAELGLSTGELALAVEHGLGDLIDDILAEVLGGGEDGLDGDADGLVRNAGVGVGGQVILNQEGIVGSQIGNSLIAEGGHIEVVGGGEVGQSGGGGAGNGEGRIALAVLEGLSAAREGVVHDLDIVEGHAVGLEDLSRVQSGTGADVADADGLALEVGNGVDAGLGKDILSSFDDGIKQPNFSIIAKNANAEDLERFIQVLEDTLASIVEQGMDKKSLLAAINYFEFKHKEGNFGRFPKGLMLGLNAFSTWLYDDAAALDLFSLNDVYDALKQDVETGYFEALIKQYILQNTHKSYCLLMPKKGLNNEIAEREKARLAAYKETLSAADIEEIRANMMHLKEYQSSGDAEEDLKKIPMLAIDDIEKHAKKINNRILEIEHVKVLSHDIFTNGITYLSLNFCMDDIDYDKFPVIALLTEIFKYVDTEHFSYSELSNEINLYTGGIGFSTSVTNKKEYGGYVTHFVVSAKMLDAQLDKAMELIEEILFTSKLSDKKRLKEIIAETRAAMKDDLLANGHTTAAGRATAYISKIGVVKELTEGVDYYMYLSDLDDHFEERYEGLAADLQETLGQLLRRDSLLVNFTSDKKPEDTLTESLTRFSCKLSTRLAFENVKEIPVVKKNEGFKTASQVQYVATAGNFCERGYEYTGALNVLQCIFSYDYLWINVRVKGGAYGCMCSFNRSGNAYFTSYRDPNLLETYEIYKEAPDYVRSFEADERDMMKYIIGAISRMDSPLTPSADGNFSLICYLMGIDDADLQRTRDEVLGATPEVIRGLAGYVEAAVDGDVICAIGDEARIEDAKDAFTEVKSVF